MSILLTSNKILLIRIMNVKIQIYAKKSHDKSQEWSLSDFFLFSFFLAYLYIFFTLCYTALFLRVSKVLFSSSFLYYVLEELVSIIQYYDVYGSALKSAQR